MEQGNSSQGSNLPLEQQPAYKAFVKPSHIPSLNFLTDETKKTYINGIQKLWDTLKSKPADDPQHKEAKSKLQTLTSDLAKKVQANRPAVQGNTQRPGSQGLPQVTAAGDGTPQQPNQAPAQQQTASQAPNQSGDIEQYRRNVEQINWLVPPKNQGNPDYLIELKKRFADAMFRSDAAKRSIQQLDNHIKQLQSNGQEVPQNIQQERQKQQSVLQHGQSFIAQINNQQTELRRASGNQGPAASGAPNVPNNPSLQNMQNMQNMQNRPMPQNAVQGNRPGGVAMPGQQGSPVQQSPHPAAPQPQTQNFATPRPPQPNSAGPFTQSPQTGMTGSSSTQQAPVPLTHQSAMDAARASYNNSQTGQQQAAGGPQANGQSLNRPDVDQKNSSRWPINRAFAPLPPQPVQMPPSRPTLTGSNNGPMGMMGQPALQQAPTYNLHGSGDRVLDKKKLDELVRQVAGAGDGSSPQGLHPEVEESIFQLADEFFDNVVVSACRLAKLRGSQTLDIRDIQLVLQRQYNIRIPGYATDEVRTVRKVQPTASYLQKMNAVQAAKVMGGKADI